MKTSAKYFGLAVGF